jgi:hypothetical protein
MMRRAAVLRIITIGLAFLHSFPARKHLGLFVQEPSLREGWKGLGALVAIALYLLPPAVQARGLSRLWRERRGLLRVASAVLVVAHGVPALDHVPRFVGAPNFGDMWRGCGAVLAMAWFASPQSFQVRIMASLGRMLRGGRVGTRGLALAEERQ